MSVSPPQKSDKRFNDINTCEKHQVLVINIVKDCKYLYRTSAISAAFLSRVVSNFFLIASDSFLSNPTKQQNVLREANIEPNDLKDQRNKH